MFSFFYYYCHFILLLLFTDSCKFRGIISTTYFGIFGCYYCFPIKVAPDLFGLGLYLLAWMVEVNTNMVDFKWYKLSFAFGRARWKTCYLWRNCIFLSLLMRNGTLSTNMCVVLFDNMQKEMFIITLLMRNMLELCGRRFSLYMLLSQTIINYIL